MTYILRTMTIPKCRVRAGKKRTPISLVFEPRASMLERILAQVFSLMKKMVPHDLMRVQITKISVYIFYPLYFFYPPWPYQAKCVTFMH